MTRVRLAVALATVAVLAVVGTVALAVVTASHDDEDAAREALVVTHPETGARFSVPAEGWEVRGPRSRIYYADDNGSPTAAVSGAAVFRDGYCADQPGDSNRGFAGFTDQTFATWRASLGGAGEVHRQEVALADGGASTLRWVRLPGGSGPCAAEGVELAMLSAGDLRVVLVADAGEEGTLGHDEIVRILSGVRAS